jgi:hypothetical protein
VQASSYASNLKGSLLGAGLILPGLPALWAARKIQPGPATELEAKSNS